MLTGTGTDGLYAGGGNGSGNKDTSFYFNGSSWSSKGDLPSATNASAGGGSGTVCFNAGNTGDSNIFYTYASDTWTNKSQTLNTGRDNHSGAGTPTSGLVFGGKIGSTYSSSTEKWNNTSWSVVNPLNTGREAPAGGGKSDGCTVFGGNDASSRFSSTEAFDGTSWTTGGSMGTARHLLGGAQA